MPAAGNAVVAAIRIGLLLRRRADGRHRSPAADRRGGRSGDRRATSTGHGGAVRYRSTGRAAIRGSSGKDRTVGVGAPRSIRAPAGGRNADRPATAPGRAAATRSRSVRSAPRRRPDHRNRVRRGRGVHRRHSRRADRVRRRRIDRAGGQRIALLRLSERSSRRAAATAAEIVRMLLIIIALV